VLGAFFVFQQNDTEDDLKVELQANSSCDSPNPIECVIRNQPQIAITSTKPNVELQKIIINRRYNRGCVIVSDDNTKPIKVLNIGDSYGMMVDTSACGNTVLYVDIFTNGGHHSYQFNPT
jgi:hypothetical protein